ncbi:transglutaminase-like domain-containing protein [Clostridium ganghwense]|uniref:Transglutaminase-like domain-containing protein n=1 Tax=Clostridium ganghwense TaxID=312089 RepID=A0ABT4CNL0_9CLOT|nr:transglutaminase-like domain-containing protein [Clostridium ganghwense]MCY6370637.1 transglutaminase-like domain-containing protein [Clostridium ganghwense]
MTQNTVDIALILIFLYPLLKGFLFKFSSKNLKNDIEEIGSYISFIGGAISGTYLTKQIFVMHQEGVYAEIYNYIPEKIVSVLDSNPIFIYVVVMPIMIFLLYKIIGFVIEIINSMTFYPLLDGIEDLIKEKSGFTKRIIGLLFQLPKSICYILLVSLVLNVLVIIGVNNSYNQKLDKSVVYSSICENIINPITNSKFAKKLPNIINDSFKIVIKNDDTESLSNSGKTIVYYNGVTLSEGIKSNKDVDQFARELVKDRKNTYEKSKHIYNWVGKNIDYDYEKVDKILRNDFSVKSGAINTFNSRKGICFDYACLYAAMCKANNIKVRIITGEGFNGSNWVSHAWNQVYISEENIWINVDTTFYKGGNYFDSSIFKLDHRNAKIAG